MISRTVRVFKLMYIVAGILISNEEICETVDRIQIAPRVEMKSELETIKKLQQLTGSGSDGTISTRRKERRTAHWYDRFNIFLTLRTWREFVQQTLTDFNRWTIPNYLLEHTSKYLSKFFISSDCDLIYK